MVKIEYLVTSFAWDNVSEKCDCLRRRFVRSARVTRMKQSFTTKPRVERITCGIPAGCG